MSDDEATGEGLTHVDPDGRARMVDVGDKPENERLARAEARVRMSPETAAAVAAADGPKGDVIGPARRRSVYRFPSFAACVTVTVRPISTAGRCGPAVRRRLDRRLTSRARAYVGGNRRPSSSSWAERQLRRIARLKPRDTRPVSARLEPRAMTPSGHPIVGRSFSSACPCG